MQEAIHFLKKGEAFLVIYHKLGKTSEHKTGN